MTDLEKTLAAALAQHGLQHVVQSLARVLSVRASGARRLGDDAGHTYYDHAAVTLNTLAERF